MELKDLYIEMVINSTKFVIDNSNWSFHRKGVFKKQIIKVISTHFDYLEDIVIRLEDNIESLQHQQRWYHLSDDKKHQIEANELCLDIAKSFMKRFVTGGEGEGQALL